MPSSVAVLRISASVEPDCQVFIVSTSSHQTYAAADWLMSAILAAGTNRSRLASTERFQPYCQEHARSLVPAQVPFTFAW